MSMSPDPVSRTSAVFQLAPPGAGLPALELAIGRRLFALARRRGDRDSFLGQIAGERDAILGLVAACPLEKRALPVLIPRPRGLEDSSRQWSICMTLDHLVITNRLMTGVIQSLAAGRVPGGVASTAAVKPSPLAGEAGERDFRDCCDQLMDTATGIANLRTEASYAHPWFGPLDAHGWLAMAATHLKLHRKQIEAIRARLP